MKPSKIKFTWWIGLQLTSIMSLVFFLLGMGGGDNKSDSSNLPLPQKNYSVVLTDHKGVETSANSLTWEGKIYLKGKYGEASITIPFSKIKKIEFLPLEDSQPKEIITKILLQSGKSVKIGLERTSKIYADTEFGQLEIFVKDLQKMDFNG